MHRFTKEQDEYFLKNHSMKTAKEFAIEFNNVFGTNLIDTQIKNYRSRNKIKSGLTGCFPKGHTPYVKGKKRSEYMTDEQIERSKSNQFKKGHKRSFTHPIGAEVSRKEDRCVFVKISDSGEWEDNWKLKHYLVWEDENGKVPTGHLLTFKNGDNHDFDINNITLITAAENAAINSLKLRSDDPILNEVGINLGRVIHKINKLEKREK